MDRGPDRRMDKEWTEWIVFQYDCLAQLKIKKRAVVFYAIKYCNEKCPQNIIFGDIYEIKKIL
jgi:hypothetical protein